MDDVVYIGGIRDAEVFRAAGIPSYAPPLGLLGERVLAERRRCNVLAMTASTFAALPALLAREVREGDGAQITIVPEIDGNVDPGQIREIVRTHLAPQSPRVGE